MNRLFVLLGIVVVAVATFFIVSMIGNRKGTGQKALRLAIDTMPDTLDPIGITDTTSDGVGRKIHSTLVRMVKDGDSVKIVPDLAEKYEISPDGKKYTFTLRKGLKFHNGREAKAEDIVYSLTRLLTAPTSKRQELMMPFVIGSKEHLDDPNSKVPLGIRALNDYTAEIELNAPFAPFILHLATISCAIVPREAVENPNPPFAQQPVGLGPFKVTEWTLNDRIVLSRFDDYHFGKPKLGEIDFFIIKEPLSRMQKFMAGELDASDIPYGSVEEARKQVAREDMLEYTTWRTNYIGIGMPNGDFKTKADLQVYGTNKKVREAVSYGLDRKRLCTKILEGRGDPATGILPPNFPGYKPGRPGWPYDIEKAKALLAEAGFPGGQGLPPLSILFRNDANTKLVVETIAQDLEAMGIHPALQPLEWNALLKETGDKPFQMFLLGWVADYPDPDNFLYVLFNSAQFGSAGNATWYSNQKVDELTNKARTLLELRDRTPIYWEAETQILEDLPWIPTYYVRNVILLRKNVKGIREAFTPLDTGTEFPSVDFASVDIE